MQLHHKDSAYKSHENKQITNEPQHTLVRSNNSFIVSMLLNKKIYKINK